MRVGGIRQENKIIWCNDKFKFIGKVLQFKHCSTRGLKLLGDLCENSTLTKNMIKSKLTKKSGIFFEFWQLKRAVPNTYNLIEPNQILIVGGK